MGHERVGALPHSRRWRDIVAQMESYSGSAEEVADLAASTLKNVRSRYQKLHVDEGVISAFQFLIALAKCASEGSRQSSSLFPTIDHDENPTPLRLVAELRTWVDANQDSQEYAEIAKKASADAIMLWSDKHKMQPTLFSEEQDSKYVWQRADNGSGFCEVTSLFFSKFTERYLNYFLEREASAVVASSRERDNLGFQLREHYARVSTYAFETSRITQSFSAGWFNRYAREDIPPREEIESFLSRAFAKMEEDLLRETSQ